MMMENTYIHIYIYIDESGDTGYTKKSTRYFIFTSVIVDDPFVLRRVAKKVHKSKIDKKKGNMLHAYRKTNRIRNKMVKEIIKINTKCIVFVLDKKQNKVNDLYFYLLEKLAEYFSRLKVNQITLARKETRNNYNKKIINMFKSYNINLILSVPTEEKSLQIADFCSWVIFIYIEYDQSEYFGRLENYIDFR